MVIDNGWEESAQAWIAIIDKGEPNRELLLDAVVLRLAGDVTDLRVLDTGSGEGRFCRMLGERGATVAGLDPTSAFTTAARERDATGAYARAISEHLPYAGASFDLVVSYLSLIDTPDYGRDHRGVARAQAGRAIPDRKPRLRHRVAGARLGS